jgi:aldehyde dehydrogenase (NAD+)
VKDRFLDLVIQEIRNCYGTDPAGSESFARVISPANVERIRSLISCGKIVAGGSCDAQNRFVEPTVISDVLPGDPIMKQEIFGPLMPVLGYSDFSEVYDIIELNPRPLATYIFSRNRKLINSFIGRTRAGTAGVNDVVMQIASPYLPYGGIGPSGIGRYHGKKSFETFSNMRSVLHKSNLFDIPVRYAPYSRLKTGIVKLLMR